MIASEIHTTRKTIPATDRLNDETRHLLFNGGCRACKIEPFGRRPAGASGWMFRHVASLIQADLLGSNAQNLEHC